MKYVITGGGSGGHIYPAIAIGQTIRSTEPESEILFVSNKGGMAKDIYEKYGFDVKEVTSRWLDRSNVFDMTKTGFATLKGIRESKKIIKDFKPDVIIGTGGFVCFPFIYATHAMKNRPKIFIQEQNAFPGITNKLLSKYATKVFMGFQKAADSFKEKDKLIVTGNPVRESFFGRNRSEDKASLGLKNEFAILVLGGSIGSKFINEKSIELIKKINGTSEYRLICVGGADEGDALRSEIKKAGIELSDNIQVLDYIHEMEKYLNAVDLVIGRAGALTLAEITACGRASIIIPCPGVTENHQYYNAKELADKGAIIMIEESDFEMERLCEEIEKVRADRQYRMELECRSLEYGSKNSAQKIYHEIKASVL